MENIFSPPLTNSESEVKTSQKLNNLITDEFILDYDGESMSYNKETFKRYQQEANLGKSKHARVLDKQVISKLVKYAKKSFDEITKEDLVCFFNDMESGNITNKWG